MLNNLSENWTSATPGRLTDKKGNFFEMIEYLPYGETLYDEAATADKTEFRFTSKEQDAETGLYYHGARYRDAKTGVWLSVDPIFEMYLPMTPISNKEKEHNKKLPGLGGVFNSVNLNLYHYAGNNPVRFIDPDGNQMADPISVWGWLVRADPIAKLLNGVYQGDQRAKIALTHCFISTANDISNMGDTMMIYGIANVNPIFVISGFYISDAGEISRISLLFVLSEQTGDEADIDMVKSELKKFAVTKAVTTLVPKVLAKDKNFKKAIDKMTRKVFSEKPVGRFKDVDKEAAGSIVDFVVGETLGPVEIKKD